MHLYKRRTGFCEEHADGLTRTKRADVEAGSLVCCDWVTACMNSVKVERNQVLAARLLRAVRGAETVDTTHARVK
jgi:hypothetical protein